MNHAARILALVAALAVVGAIASPPSGSGSKIVPTNSVSTVSVASRDTSGRAPSDTTGSKRIAAADTLAKPKVDSSDLKQLPPRALPLKEQMMFAGGFMICVAIMLTSMQNFNPND